MTQITSVEQLKELCNGVPRDCFISLGGGIRSSKSVEYYENSEEFYVVNYIDGTDQTLKEKELFTKSNIGEAIEKGAFYLD